MGIIEDLCNHHFLDAEAGGSQDAIGHTDLNSEVLFKSEIKKNKKMLAYIKVSYGL